MTSGASTTSYHAAPQAPVAATVCSATSLAADEPMIGTASGVRAWLLLEHPGSWGHDALTGSRLDAAVRRRLLRIPREDGARPLLVRRPRTRPAVGPAAPRRLFLVDSRPGAERAVTTLLSDVRELLDLDVAAFVADGSDLGLDRYDGALFCVCTHGRHDRCCAERGRPVARELAAAYPQETWESSHIGGDRFAASMVALPHGMYYGRLDLHDASAVAATHLAGRVALDAWRGRSGLPFAAQVADLHVRRERGLDAIDAVRVVGTDVSGRRSTVRLEVRDGAGAVEALRLRVEASPAATERLLTCRSEHPSHPPTYAVDDAL